MRILSALVLTHCFGCVIPDDSDDEFTSKKCYNCKYVGNVTENNTLILNGDRQRNHQQLRNLFSTNELKTALKNQPNNLRNISNTKGTLTDRKPKERHTHTLAYQSVPLPASNKSIQVKPGGLIQRQRNEITSRGIHSHPRFHTKLKRRHRKFVNYPEREADRQFPANRKLLKVDRNKRESKYSFLREEMGNAIERDIDKITDAWDDWSNWSTCSVTCGRGRQVRWRHCSSEDCIKGLKKAQIKSCQLKDCESKGFLKWLGIKT